MNVSITNGSWRRMSGLVGERNVDLDTFLLGQAVYCPDLTFGISSCRELARTVIGDFRFLEQPCECDVTLELSLSPSGERLGTLRFGCDVQAKLDEIGFAARQETLPLASALPYAIAVAMQSETPLVLTGDPTVWKPHWGMLRATSSVKSPA